jgi:hypothetical protein
MRVLAILRIMRRLVPLVIVGLTLGCAGPSFDGNWNVAGLPGLPPGSTTTATFASPDKVTVKVTVDTEVPGMGKVRGSFTGQGTYKVQGDTMTLAVTDVQAETDGLPEAMKGMAKPLIEGAKGQMKAGLTRSDLKVKWEGQDKFVLSWPEGSATFDRSTGG